MVFRLDGVNIGDTMGSGKCRSLACITPGFGVPSEREYDEASGERVSVFYPSYLSQSAYFEYAQYALEALTNLVPIPIQEDFLKRTIKHVAHPARAYAVSRYESSA
jgi:hypothetical protein